MSKTDYRPDYARMLIDILGLAVLCLGLMAIIQMDRGVSLSTLAADPTMLFADMFADADPDK
jgi:hypothetical protein